MKIILEYCKKQKGYHKKMINKGLNNDSHLVSYGKYHAFCDIIERIEALTIPVVNNWVAVKEYLPDNCDQVFVKYENGKYGINEWWESDDCWKYQFDNMIVKEWCKTPCS